MCVSLRGGTYYGASLHLTVGALFLGGFFVDLLGLAEIWHNPYATYFSLILAFIYICLFIGFGVLIFRGAETESGKLLKGSITGFVALQISAFFVYLVIFAITTSLRNSRRSSLPNTNNTSLIPEDLSELEAILEEASQELRQNQSRIPILETSVAPESLDLSKQYYEQSIISIYQIAIIILGAVGTFAYASVVIMYIREISSDNSRIRSGRR